MIVGPYVLGWGLDVFGGGVWYSRMDLKQDYAKL